MSRPWAGLRAPRLRFLPPVAVGRALLVVLCVYGIELVQSWLTTRPAELVLASLPLDDSELFEPGGLYLLEIARLWRSSLWPALLLTLRLGALAWLLGLPARALLLRQACRGTLQPGAPDSDLVNVGRLSVRLGLQQLFFLGLIAVLALVGALALGLTGAAIALLERPFWLGGTALCLFLVGVGLQLWADATALRLTQGRRFFFSVAQSFAGARSSGRLGARALKSLLVLGAAALGLVINHRAVDHDSAWLELSLTTLALGLIALDLAWYSWLSARLGQPTRPAQPRAIIDPAGLSAPRPPLADRSASSGEPDDPTPNLGA